MDSPLTFSDHEIEEELARLGYHNIPRDKLRDFQRDLNKLVEAEKSRANSSDNSFASGDGAVNGRVLLQDNISGGQDLSNSAARQGAGDSHLHCLRREDLELHDQRQADLVPRRTVPGSYALFELPQTRLQSQALRDDVSETDSEIRRMKRKTLRKNEEGAKFIDESMSDIDAASIVETHRRMERLVLRDLDPLAPARSQSARSCREPPPYRLDPDDPRPASVIYPMMEHPHTKNLRRADPVMRYQQFQQAWATQQPPGEKQHKGLRWNVREQMLTQFVPEKKPQRKFVPNKYVPPPDKKRSALRWQIRMDMAQGSMPINS